MRNNLCYQHLRCYIWRSFQSCSHFDPGIIQRFPPLQSCQVHSSLVGHLEPSSNQRSFRYIIAQILGGYIACLLIYVQWHDLIKESELVLAAAGTLDATLFTPQGPAGAFGLYVIPGLNLGGVFLNEFVTVRLISPIIDSILNHVPHPRISF